MLRFLSFLFNKPYEPCKSCETLKQQLSFANEEKKQLTETLLSILKPKVYEAPPIELNSVTATAGLFSRRRAALEAKDREEARILIEAKHLGKPDNLKNINQNQSNSVEELEKELGVVSTDGA